jgi:hypothetical protein
MTFSVAEALDAYVEAQSEPHPFDDLWHPSSISGCQRKSIYEIRQTEPTNPKTLQQKRILFIGSFLHVLFQTAVRDHGRASAVHSEVQVLISELNTGGKGDQLVIFEDDTSELEEFKSIKEWGFKKLEGPKEDHLEQIIPYMFALREFGGVSQDGITVEPQGDRLKQVRFTYIEKQTLETKEFVVDWNPDWEQQLRAKIDNLESYKADPNSLPPRLPMLKGKRHWMCSWGTGVCPFFTRCWDQDEDEIAPTGLDF